MSNHIEIFINNKLISCDTIVPFIMSLQKINSSIKVKYYTLDYSSYTAIKNNKFLYYSLKKTGALYLIGSTGKHSKYKRIYLKIKTSIFLLKLFFKLFVGNTKIFHFGILFYPPYNILSLFFSKKIFLFEPSSWIEHENGMAWDDMAWDDLGTKKKIIKAEKIFLSKNIVYFNENFLQEKVTGKNNHILMTSSRTYRTWFDHVIKHGVPKCKSFLKNLNHNYQNGYFVYIMGYIGNIEGMASEKSIELLIPKTLSLLSKYGKGLPILIKPHSITNMNILNKIIEKYDFNNVYITYLHPAVLSVNAKLVVSNYYSNSQADAYFFGAKTVEFTDYSKLALEKLHGKSINPNYIEHFINNDSLKFKYVVQESLRSNYKNRVRKIYEDVANASLVKNFCKNNII
jgi:hypothetical protein